MRKEGRFMWVIEVDVVRLKGYLRENWGAPFIIGFMLLLLVCAGLLTGGNSVLANEVAVYAYFLLVIGVVLQLVSFLRGGNRASKLKDAEVE